MLDRMRYCVLAFLLLPIEFAASADANEWTAAPIQWTEQLDDSAFCRPGEWFFDPIGEQVRAVEPAATAHQHANDAAVGTVRSPQFGEVSAASVFLKAIGKRAASRNPGGPQADEVTTLRIARDNDGEFTIQAFAGTTLAAWRIYEAQDSECRPGMSLRINTIAEMSPGEKTSLALANDGSLIVRQDNKDDFFWPLFLMQVGSFYARFPAANLENRTPTSAN